MTNPIKPAIFSNLPLSVSGATPTQSPLQGFSQWMDKHTAEQAHSSQLEASAKPLAPMPNKAPAYKKAAEQVLSPEPPPRAPEQAKQAASSAQDGAEQPGDAAAQPADVPTAKSAAKDGKATSKSAKADGKAAKSNGKENDKVDDSQPDASKPEDKTAIVAAPDLLGSAKVQPSDSASLMAWPTNHGQSAGKGLVRSGSADTTSATTQSSANASTALPAGGSQALTDVKADAKATKATKDVGIGAAQVDAQTALQSTSFQATHTQAEALVLSTMMFRNAPDQSTSTDALNAMLVSGIKDTPWAQARADATAPRHDVTTLSTPFGSADFAQALTEKISMWVSSARTDGPMTAELHLNPADMGPINVKIAIDGVSAQIDFAASALETRKALENSMPMLSNALDSVGLSLTGGDVSSQTSQQAFEQSFAQSGGQARANNGLPAARPGDVVINEAGAVRQVSVPLPGRQGGLDLYA